MHATLQNAAAAAQSIIASMGGAATPGASNFTLAGTAYQGVLQELSATVPGIATGFEVIRELRIVATRTQFAAKPDPAGRPALTALGVTWYLVAVSESPLHYTLTARPA